MEIWKIIKMLERKTTVPQDGEEFCDISKAFDAAIVSLEELKQYRKIGAVQELEQISRDFKRQIEHSEKLSEVLDSTKNLLKKRENILNKYYAIGTVEECREARERQRAKKVKNRKLLRDFHNRPHSVRGDCPNCGSEGLLATNTDYCNACGQKLDWSENNGE